MKLYQIALAASLLFPGPTHAGAIASVEKSGVGVTLFDASCTLKEIANLPFHVEWMEKGNIIEGCWGLHPAGIVILYFADKTVTIIPAQEFKKANTI